MLNLPDGCQWSPVDKSELRDIWQDDDRESVIDILQHIKPSSDYYAKNRRWRTTDITFFGNLLKNPKKVRVGDCGRCVSMYQE
jgi:hypothetical protein